MKNLLLLIPLIALLAACSDSDDTTPAFPEFDTNIIVGKWSWAFFLKFSDENGSESLYANPNTGIIFYADKTYSMFNGNTISPPSKFKIVAYGTETSFRYYISMPDLYDGDKCKFVATFDPLIVDHPTIDITWENGKELLGDGYIREIRTYRKVEEN